VNKTKQYLQEKINYGGVYLPRGIVIKDMLLKGATIQQVNLWFAGYESQRAEREAGGDHEKG